MRIVATKQLPLTQLKTYPGNPRRGDVAAIKQSLERTGQFRALIVRQGTNEILGGNHTYRAMVELEWSKALAHLIECTDAEARRIVAADNRTAELGGYDDDELTSLLTEIAEDDDGLAGTGWEADDLAKLLGDDGEDDNGNREPQLGDVQYRIVVECDGEHHQAQLLERFEEEGLRTQAIAQ